MGYNIQEVVKYLKMKCIKCAETQLAYKKQSKTISPEAGGFILPG